MKKLNIVVLCVATVMLAGCGSKDNTPQETTPEASCNDYKKLCEQGEFQKAYSIVEKYKADMQKYNVAHAAAIKLGEKGISAYTGNSEAYKSLRNKYEEAKKYVVLQEATSVLQQKDLNMVARIPMIVKEHKALWLYEEIFSISRMIPDNDVIAVLSDVMLEDLTPKVMKPAEHSSWDEDVDQYMEEAQRYNMLLDKLVDHLLDTNNEETKKYAVKGLAVPEADDNSQVVFSTEEARQIAAKVK